MNFKLFAIYDKRTGEYSPPQTYITTGQAERALYDAVHDQQSAIARHPEDYNLQEIGTYESETATLQQTAIHIICEAAQLINK